jgi:hypothetical protein
LGTPIKSSIRELLVKPPVEMASPQAAFFGGKTNNLALSRPRPFDYFSLFFIAKSLQCVADFFVPDASQIPFGCILKVG